MSALSPEHMAIVEAAPPLLAETIAVLAALMQEVEAR